ncbi:MAG: YkgJ family cysteine cluster protein [Candidatus Helarchaeota archaeon]
MSSPPKFVFECLEDKCPDRKCCNRSPVMIYFEDVKRWTTDQTINVVYSNLELTVDPTMRYPMMILRKYPNETLCSMFNKETKNCNIYYSKPISCSAYPLGFNGNNFYLVDKECPGIGKGEMTKELLKEMRNRAKLEFECRTRTTSTLPLIQMLVMQFFQKQSEQAMASLSEEDKKKLEEILAKREAPAETKEEKTSPKQEEVSESKESS